MRIGFAEFDWKHGGNCAQNMSYVALMHVHHAQWTVWTQWTHMQCELVLHYFTPITAAQRQWYKALEKSFFF